MYVFPRTDSEEAPRLGLSVSRKVGGAVERNHVKRLLREAFRSESSLLPAGSDVVVVARPDAKALAEREGVGGVRRELGQLLARAAGVKPRTAGTDEDPSGEQPDPQVEGDSGEGGV